MGFGDDSTLTIGDAATHSGLSAHTLRYYERAGLIDPVERGSEGERRYASGDLEWVAFLSRLRATRMPVREMARFADLRRAGPSTLADRRELLEAHRERVRDQIARLWDDLGAIDAKLTRLESGVDANTRGSD